MTAKVSGSSLVNKTWEAAESKNGELHISPCNDSRVHGWAQCWCHPVNNYGEFLHNAADGRGPIKRSELELLWHGVAESACIRGDAATLSKYLRQVKKVSTGVVQNIAHCLLATADNPGPGNWQLVFSRRAGAPPRKKIVPSNPPSNAAQALVAGQAISARGYLLQNPQIDKATQEVLADLLNPIGRLKWKLTFERLREGNPGTTDLKRDIHDVVIRHTDQVAQKETNRKREEIYPTVTRDLGKLRIKAGRSKIRAARFVVEMAKADQYLRKKLSDGPVPAQECKECAKAIGISRRMVERACERLKIIAKSDGKKGTTWRLPTAEEPGIATMPPENASNEFYALAAAGKLMDWQLSNSTRGIQWRHARGYPQIIDRERLMAEAAPLPSTTRNRNWSK